MNRSIAAILTAATFLFVLPAPRSASAAPAAAGDSSSRPIWGGESLWGYWEFGSEYLPKHQWKLLTAVEEGSKFIDHDANTFTAVKGQDIYEFIIDLGASSELGAFTMLTTETPNAKLDLLMGKFELYVGETSNPGGEAVVAGEFAGEEGKETVVRFPRTARGRYVKLRARPRPGTAERPNPGKEICLREFRLVSPETLKKFSAAKDSKAAAKKSAWEQRDSDETLLAFSKEFLSLVYCDRDRYGVGLSGRKKLEAACKLNEAGRTIEALKAFRDYYFDKLRNPQSLGIHPGDVSPTGRGVAGLGDFPQAPMPKDLSEEARKSTLEMGDELLQGLMRIGGKKVSIGEPGTVDWEAPGPPYGSRTASRSRGPYHELITGTGIRPLWMAYLWTKKAAYLERWLAYMDDWALNCTWYAEISPAVNDDSQMYPVVETIRMFGGVAQSLPEASEIVKPQVFARILRKLAMESPLNYTVFYRSNCNAWSPGGNQMLLSILLDEFKVSKIYFRETVRRNIEDINAIQMLRDGTDPHQWFGYNAVVLTNNSVFRLMNARENAFWFEQPAWEKKVHDPAWQVEERELLETRARWILRWCAPNGDYPMITQFGSSQKSKTLEQIGKLPTQMNDPLNLRLFQFFYGNGFAPAPEHTSDAFPYGGFFIARTGWGQNQGYGAMFCSPMPGLNSASKNNVFGLSAYGMDLLNDDIAHNYARRDSPINVDGLRQDMDFYVPQTGWPSAHRGEMIRSWTDPAPWRWHASDRFNVMEGVYAGAYSNDYAKRADAVKDVQHQRLALFVRQAGLWIITDRLRCSSKHDYEQIWWLPLKNEKKNGYGGFDRDGIVVDAAARSVRTRRTRTDQRDGDVPGSKIVIGNVNLSMYQFSDAVVAYVNKEVKSDEPYNWERIGVKWQGEGDQQIVTALFPRKPTPEKPKPDGTENDLQSIKALPKGFEALTPEGFRIAYLSAKAGEEILELEGVRILGEALLVTRDPAEKGIHGMAFGCRELSLNGRKVSAPRRDCEFTLPEAGGVPVFESIERPMGPLKILPETDAFVKEQEITFVSDVPDALMTYTLDGTEPTPQSTVYKGPFKIDRNYAVKGRAYRPGCLANPTDLSGTRATPVTTAKYTRQFYAEPETAAPTMPGLKYDYCDGDWKDLWLLADRQAPRKKGVVTSLFDMSAIPAENRPLTGRVVPRQNAYSFTYTGFLKVPEDGIYTVHAPREFVHPEQIAGYELQVSLGHAVVLDQGKPVGVSRSPGLSFWYPSTRLHGLGTWSVPLKKGFHEFKVFYLDYRMDAPLRMNRKVEDPDLRDPVWTGEKPALELSGPKLPRQPIPTEWLWH